MLIKRRLIIIFAFVIVLFGGCSFNKNATTDDYQTITATNAYEIMQQRDDIVILDVRTESEFDSGHISNAILIPDDEIEEKAESILTDKNATILVYCRSGRRSALASEELASLGYTDVYDFGGINDWEYEIVTEEN